MSLKSYISALTFLVLANSTAAIADDRGVEIRVLQHTDVTDDSIEHLQEGMSTIPMPIQHKIREAGIHILLAPRFVDAEPESSGNQVFRGGGNTENVGGMFEGGKNRVLIPERASWGHSPPHAQGKGLAGIIRHELGHAWDSSLHHASSSPVFIKEYDQDFSHLSNEQCRKFAYSITGVSKSDANVPTASGRSECFAIMMDMLCSPESKRKPEFLAAFPHVERFMQHLEPQLKTAPPEVAKQKQDDRLGGEQRSSGGSGGSSGHLDDAAIEATAAKAQSLIAAAKYNEAIKVLDRAIDADSRRTRLYFIRGTACIWTHDYHSAIRNFNEYITAFPDDVEAHRQRANAYGWLGQAGRQQWDLRRAEQLENHSK